MEGNIKEKMARGIESTRAVLVFITKNYMTKVDGENLADNCKLEFGYASRKKTAARMLPVVMEEDMRNTSQWFGEVGFELGGLLYVDMSEALSGWGERDGDASGDSGGWDDEIYGDDDIDDGNELFVERIEEIVTRLMKILSHSPLQVIFADLVQQLAHAATTNSSSDGAHPNQSKGVVRHSSSPAMKAPTGSGGASGSAHSHSSFDVKAGLAHDSNSGGDDLAMMSKTLPANALSKHTLTTAATPTQQTVASTLKSKSASHIFQRPVESIRIYLAHGSSSAAQTMTGVYDPFTLPEDSEDTPCYVKRGDPDKILMYRAGSEDTPGQWQLKPFEQRHEGVFFACCSAILDSSGEKDYKIVNEKLGLGHVWRVSEQGKGVVERTDISVCLGPQCNPIILSLSLPGEDETLGRMLTGIYEPTDEVNVYWKAPWQTKDGQRDGLIAEFGGSKGSYCWNIKSAAKKGKDVAFVAIDCALQYGSSLELCRDSSIAIPSSKGGAHTYSSSDGKWSIKVAAQYPLKVEFPQTLSTISASLSSMCKLLSGVYVHRGEYSVIENSQLGWKVEMPVYESLDIERGTIIECVCPTGSNAMPFPQWQVKPKEKRGTTTAAALIDCPSVSPLLLDRMPNYPNTDKKGWRVYDSSKKDFIALSPHVLVTTLPLCAVHVSVATSLSAMSLLAGDYLPCLTQSLPGSGGITLYRHRDKFNSSHRELIVENSGGNEFSVGMTGCWQFKSLSSLGTASAFIHTIGPALSSFALAPVPLHSLDPIQTRWRYFESKENGWKDSAGAIQCFATSHASAIRLGFCGSSIPGGAALSGVYDTVIDERATHAFCHFVGRKGESCEGKMLEFDETLYEWQVKPVNKRGTSECWAKLSLSVPALPVEALALSLSLNAKHPPQWRAVSSGQFVDVKEGAVCVEVVCEKNIIVAGFSGEAGDNLNGVYKPESALKLPYDGSSHRGVVIPLYSKEDDDSTVIEFGAGGRMRWQFKSRSSLGSLACFAQMVEPIISLSPLEHCWDVAWSVFDSSANAWRIEDSVAIGTV